MPRRVFTYPDLPDYEFLNMTSTIGAFIMGFSILFLIYILYVAIKHGEKAPRDPWGAYTLEWIADSPPDLKNFDTVPPIKSYRPLRDLKHPDLLEN